MNTRLAALLASLLLASTGPALAAEPAAATPPASATKLAQILLPKTAWSQGIDQLGKVVQMQMRGHPGSQPLEYPPDFDAKVRAELEKVLSYDDLLAIHAKELAATYTPAELDGLLAFYGAPLGQKTLQKNAEVSSKVSQATQQRVQSKMPEVMKRLAAFAKPSDKPATGGMPSGHPAVNGMPPGHPPMNGSTAAPAKKAAAPATKGAAKPKAKTDASKAQAETAVPKADSNAAAPKADAPAATKAEADAAAPKTQGEAAK